MNFDHPDLVNSLAYLQDMHKSWRDFVASDSMSETEIKIQTAIWELVTTEVYYIHALQTVTDVSRFSCDPNLLEKTPCGYVAVISGLFGGRSEGRSADRCGPSSIVLKCASCVRGEHQVLDLVAISHGGT